MWTCMIDHKLIGICFLTGIYFLAEPVDNFNMTGCCRYDSSLGEPSYNL